MKFLTTNGILILVLATTSAYGHITNKVADIAIHIIQGNIVALQSNGKPINCDVIVNAANDQLKQGGGVCGIIFDAAQGNGTQLSDFIKSQYPNGIKSGQAIITKSFDLQSNGIQAIIHAVGPIYNAKTPTQAAEELHHAYESSLFLAHIHNHTSIAFPFISSGIYGYPKQEAADIAYKALVQFAQKTQQSTIKHIYMVLYNYDDYKIFEKIAMS